ncbi:DUF883 family protein [Chitinasiproducens palmae]|uniref:Membrane-anchored ribosome-binding protein, inhibits growth in stationary phase, ElaB/YqjD/DUF883 family n=1 Tax=Chitinasiproducens palmae TaxID=1770053 RepID=A0A1H2PMF9_9BURK|nr:DUF883 family protein [Chitinasiproducens palmae]SDV47723.1 Membrane-anchored ribosome-binding protein, inhibits growth in stationary phase, ElaB/YqjD/DUF883 family [Chitinasiproducens palmae]
MSDTSTSVQLSLGKAKISEDLRVLLSDVQELVRLTATASGEGIEELRGRLGERVQALRGTAGERFQTLRGSAGGVHATAMSSCRSAYDCADSYVQEKPWQAVGIGVGVGILIGALLSR